MLSKLDEDIEELLERKKKAEENKKSTQGELMNLKKDREDTEDSYIRLKESNNRANLDYASLNE